MATPTDAKQLVRFPYCRLYRRFIRSLTENPQIRKQGQALLFRYIVLFSLANFRSSLRTIAGFCYTIQPGSWVASCRELCDSLHLRTRSQLITVLSRLQELGFIQFQADPHCKVIRFKINCWEKTNTCLKYSAPCPKDTGFFFFPIAQLPALLGEGRCSEADILLDLWLNTVFQDDNVPGSKLEPVVYYRSQSSLPSLSYAMLAARWSVSKATVHRVLKKFEQLSILTTRHYSGRQGSVIILRDYLQTMFGIHSSFPTQPTEAVDSCPSSKSGDYSAESGAGTVSSAPCSVSLPFGTVSKSTIRLILENLRNSLYASGFRCFACPHAIYRLSNLSDCKEEIHPYDLAIVCGAGGPSYQLSIGLQRAPTDFDVITEVI